MKCDRLVKDRQHVDFVYNSVELVSAAGNNANQNNTPQGHIVNSCDIVLFLQCRMSVYKTVVYGYNRKTIHDRDSSVPVSAAI